MTQIIDQHNGSQLVPFNPQQVLIQKDRQQAADTAALLAAATKNGQALGDFEHEIRDRRPVFMMNVEQILTVSAIAGCLAFAVVAAVQGASILELLFAYPAGFSAWRISLYWAAGASTAVFIGLVALAVSQMKDTYHEKTRISFRSSEQSGVAAVAVKQTFKLEITEGNRIAFVDLPDWFTDDRLLQLADHSLQGGSFNVKALERLGICTQKQYPQLRDKFHQAGLARKNGRSWALTDHFFQLAEQVEID